MKKSTFFILLILILAVGLELAACFVPGFSDLWRHFFPVTGRIPCYLTSRTGRSVGEIMILCGLAWLVILFVTLLYRLYVALFHKTGSGKKHGFSSFFLKATAWLLVIISLIMVCNCFIFYHCTSLKKSLGGETTFSSEELATLRDMVVERCNSMALDFERDENGVVISPGEDYMKREASSCIEKLSERFPDLKGFRSLPKPLYFSDFMCQQSMMGYFFPFSLEANYNTLMEDLNKPYTMCHELSHTHGYLFEDEANFIGFLACTLSDDEYFVYSGYLGILWYVDNEFYMDAGKEEYFRHVAVSDLVFSDAIFVTEDTMSEVEEDALLPTELVKSGADTFVDTTLKVNGVSSGKKSYSEVVTLLLMELLDTAG